MKSIPFTACLAVKDVTQTLDFFESLGYDVTRQSLAENHAIHLIHEGNTPLFMIQPEKEVHEFMPQLKNYNLGESAFFYINTSDIDAAIERIRDKVDIVLESTEGGYKVFYFKDPNGYIFGLNQAV